MGHPVHTFPNALPEIVTKKLPNDQELKIRGVLRGDVPALAHIYCESYKVNGGGEHWTPERAALLLQHLIETDAKKVSVVALLGERIVSAAFGRIRPWESGKNILDGTELFVDPNLQKQGIANELLQERLHRAEVWGRATDVEIVTFALSEEPKGYHGRTGFRRVEELQIMSTPVEVVKAGLARRSNKEDK